MASGKAKRSKKSKARSNKSRERDSVSRGEREAKGEERRTHLEERGEKSKANDTKPVSKTPASKTSASKTSASKTPASKPPASKPPASKLPAADPEKSKGRPGGGILALFDGPDATLDAARRARDEGVERWDVYTPFPVHGMDEAMGLGRSPVPWITFVAGVAGLCAAVIIQFGTMVYSWPLNFGGKPFAAWPSFVPISFEMTVLAAGVCTAIGSLMLGGVFKLHKRIPHPDVTNHRFAIFVEASDPNYDEKSMCSLFEDAGAIEVRAVKEDA